MKIKEKKVWVCPKCGTVLELPQNNNKHWTKTEEGRKHLSEIAKKRWKRVKKQFPYPVHL